MHLYFQVLVGYNYLKIHGLIGKIGRMYYVQVLEFLSCYLQHLLQSMKQLLNHLQLFANLSISKEIKLSGQYIQSLLLLTTLARQ